MSDLLFQNLSTVQSNLQPTPVTVTISESVESIAPTTFITFVAGTGGLANVTPPVSGQHMLVLIFTDNSPGAFETDGNIQRVVTPTQNIPVLLFYDPISAKYYVIDGAV
jgi:hypothetical protein